MNLLKNVSFLLATAVFLILALGSAWLFYPKLIAEFKEARIQKQALDQQIASAQEAASNLQRLQSDRVKLDELYRTALQALPQQPEPEQLLLQLDGLAKSLGLDLKKTVPFTNAAAPVASPTPSASGSEEVKPGSGSVGSSQPVIASSPTVNTQFSLSGRMSFAQAKTLIGKLDTLLRWNKISSIDLSSAESGLDVTISGEVFSAGVTSSTFSGSATDLIKSAGDLFAQFVSYASKPDAGKEGTYGRENPFAL